MGPDGFWLHCRICAASMVASLVLTVMILFGALLGHGLPAGPFPDSWVVPASNLSMALVLTWLPSLIGLGGVLIAALVCAFAGAPVVSWIEDSNILGCIWWVAVAGACMWLRLEQPALSSWMSYLGSIVGALVVISGFRAVFLAGSGSLQESVYGTFLVHVIAWVASGVAIALHVVVVLKVNKVL